MLHHLNALNLLFIRLALGAAIAGFMVWSYISTRNRLRDTFAQKWGLSRASTNRIYARRHSNITTTLMWLAGGPVFVFAVFSLVMVFGANIYDINKLLVYEMYWIPFALVMMGLNFLLMPARDIAYGFRLKMLKPTDFTSSLTRQDFEAALTAPPPHYYGFRIAGLIFLALAGALIWAETTYHPQTWLDMHLPQAARVTPSILPTPQKP